MNNTERRVVCQSCNQPFDCCASSPGGCWCLAVSIPEPTLQQLRETYSDCICKTCLLRAAMSASDAAHHGPGNPLPGQNDADTAQKNSTKA